MAQLVECRLLILAQVMISWFVSSRSEPARDSLSPSLCPSLLMLSLSLSLSQNKQINIKKKRRELMGGL